MTIQNKRFWQILLLGGINLSGGVFFSWRAETPPILSVPSPLPPSIVNDGAAPLMVPPPPQVLSQSAQAELIFQQNPPQPSELIFRRDGAAPPPLERQAPAPEPSSPRQSPVSPNGAIFYRVQVKGDSPRLLAQVKQIEPLAYVSQTDQTIQAGTFTQNHLAQERLEQLTRQGLEALVLPVTPQDNLGISHPSQLRYQAR
ncbi:MAG: hypothetical protein GC158_01305 [Cyanobacteria bacterium RI_101]|nr:hypothetical protein [Cyanobacteria bacterium RI_101]